MFLQILFQLPCYHFSSSENLKHINACGLSLSDIQYAHYIEDKTTKNKHILLSHGQI